MNTEIIMPGKSKLVVKKSKPKEKVVKKSKSVAKKGKPKEKIAAAKVDKKSSVKKDLGFDPTEVVEYTTAVSNINPEVYDFPIATVRPIVKVGGKEVPLVGQTVIVRTDNNLILGQFGGHYNVVPHTETVDIFETIIGEDPVLKHFERKVNLTHNGARLWMTYTFGKAGFKLNGDNMRPRLTMVNTLDRSHRWQIILELYRLVCLNGMITPINISISEIHTKNRLNHETITNYLGQIRDNMRQLPEHTQDFRRLGEVEIKDPVRVMSDLWSRNNPVFRFPRKYAGNVMETFENQPGRTAWHFYNAFNSVINRGFVEQNRYARSRMLDLNLYTTFHAHFK